MMWFPQTIKNLIFTNVKGDISKIKMVNQIVNCLFMLVHSTLNNVSYLVSR